jgi:hypothetical protein
MRRPFVIGCLLVLACGAGPAGAQTADPTQGVRVCLVDSGVNAAHQEFAPGQLVGYWDFTDVSSRKAGAFDPKHEPADDHALGHGTLAAAMAVGRNRSPRTTPSFAPGFPFAMADVMDPNGTVSGDVAAGIRWCVDTIGAAVINVSIGSLTPTTGFRDVVWGDDYAALRYAREKGVLITVGNGNGTANVGAVPGDGAITNYGSSVDVLSVGGAGTDGALISWQPEVAAQYGITGPSNQGTDGYRDWGGTSFSSPLVGGFAARLIAEARSVGRTLKAEQLEALVKSAARDTEIPPVWEGYGVVDAAQLPAALAAARAGTLVARPDPDVSAVYVEDVAGTEREVSDMISPS